MDLILWNLLYILAYVIWSIYFKFNHPLPQLGLILIPTWILFMIGIWFIPPSDIVSKKHFRKRMKFYMLYQLWQFIAMISREILSNLFANAPLGFQFLIPFLVAGCREIDANIRSKLVTKMMLVKDERSITLHEIIVISEWSFFIGIEIFDFNT